MSGGDYLRDLELFCAEWLKQNAGCELIDHGFGPDHGGELTTDLVLKAVAELKQLRAEREGWRDGASQRLRHAYRSGWEERGETIAAAVSAFAGHGMAEQRAKAYVDEWWDVAPEQPERGGVCGEELPEDPAALTNSLTMINAVCALQAGHGGDWHDNRRGVRWPNRTQGRPDGGEQP